MKKYIVQKTARIFLTNIVEAQNSSEAIKKARKLPISDFHISTKILNWTISARQYKGSSKEEKILKDIIINELIQKNVKP